MPDLATAWTFQATFGAPTAAEAVCVHDDDPEERHQVTAQAASEQVLELFGLLADTSYTCSLTRGYQQTVRHIHTDPLPGWLPDWSTVVTDRSSDDYTLFNHGTDRLGDRQPKLLLVDRQGRLRWYHNIPFEAADIDASYQGDGAILYGGGIRVVPTIVELSGAVWLRAPPSSTGRGYHHHASRIETGEVATLTFARNYGAGRGWTGAAVDVLDPGMSVQTFIWNTQRGVDEGWLPVPEPGVSDPYHANSVQFEGDNLFLNLRQLSWVVKLRRDTHELEWILGPGGDFRLINADGTDDAVTNWFYKPHAPEKDGNRILFYDNGEGRPGNSYSRIVELTIDEVARTAQVTWSYSERGWYEPIWGDVDRLPNGNVLFMRAHCGKCVPKRPEQRTEIVEVAPDTKEVVWRLTMAAPSDGGYRAERIDPCAIFANSKYCPR